MSWKRHALKVWESIVPYELDARIKGSVARLITAKMFFRTSPPILVHQVGKVGSMSVVTTLKAEASHRPIFNVHTLNPRRQRQDRTRWKELGKRITPKKALAEATTRWILTHRDRREPLFVISSVRDPMARNISSFFQNIELHAPGFRDASHANEGAVDRLIHTFLETYPHRYCLRWFDEEIRDVYGLDIFQSAFPKARGYGIYEAAGIRLLIYRLEDMDSCGATALSEFLDLDILTLKRANQGHEKRYSQTYRLFRKRFNAPVELVDQLYSSEYVRYFYGDESIERLRSRWIK